MDISNRKNVLITGISGFIGSHLARKLRAQGHIVYGISRSLKNRYVFPVDIHRFQEVSDFIRAKKIDICFHLAGETIVEKGQEQPHQTYTVNIQGTLNILEASRKYNVRKIIVASTSHVYGKNRVPYYEGYTPRPSRPYETSKACVDLIATSYANTYNLPVIIPRFVNIYGPGDLNFTRIIPRTIKRIIEGKPLQMWGPDVIRDYLYIDDAVNALVRLSSIPKDKLSDNRIFNFGSGNPIRVYDILQLIRDISRSSCTIERIEDERKQEIRSQYVSSAKARRVLGWSPAIPFDVGLKRTVRWYKSFFMKNMCGI